MCGIAGLVFHGDSAGYQPLLADILLSQTARGPDYTGQTLIDSSPHAILLGHNRLSIIDLHERANQPLWDVSHTNCVVFNGEIYNFIELRRELKQLGFQFATESDTEVLLQAYAAWGSSAFQRFNGQFAFALYDSRQHKLVLGRDRFGKKPLYYFFNGAHFYFASTVAALAKHLKLRPNLSYLARGLRYNLYEDDSSISPYEKLNALLPAHFLEVSLSDSRLSLRQYPYYNLFQQVAELREHVQQASQATVLEQLQDCIESAISLRLRADVPLAMSLSGGLDSATILAYAMNKVDKLAVFSFGYPGVGGGEGKVVQQLTEQHLQLDASQVHYIWPDVAQFKTGFSRTLAAQQAPFPTLSIVAQNMVFNAVADAGFKVLLGGQGGDEALMGYRKYLLFYLRQLRQERDYLKLIGYGYYVALTSLAEIRRLRQFWQARKKFNAEGGLEHQLSLPAGGVLNLGVGDQEPLWQRQLTDVTRFSLPTLLRYEDRNSLGNSVESRLPFMDYRFIELGLAIPESFKIKQGYGKWILREMMRNRLPKSMLKARQKVGFEAQDSFWLHAGVGTFLRDQLQARMANVVDYLRTPIDVNQRYADGCLMQQPNRLTEMISLLWLSQQ